MNAKKEVARRVREHARKEYIRQLVQGDIPAIKQKRVTSWAVWAWHEVKAWAVAARYIPLIFKTVWEVRRGR